MLRLGSMVKSHTVAGNPASHHGNGAGIAGLEIFEDARARALWPASLRAVECTMHAPEHSLSPPGRGYSSVSSVYRLLTARPAAVLVMHVCKLGMDAPVPA